MRIDHRACPISGPRAATLLALLSLTACGGGQAEPTTGGGLSEAPPPPPAPVDVSGTDEARATVGPAGGTLALANGGRLEVPADALAEPGEVVLRVGADGQAFGDGAHQRALGPMIAIAPQLVSQGAPLRVSIPEQPIPNGWEPADLALAMEEVSSQQRAIDTLGTVTRWQFYPARVEGGRLVAEVGGVPGHRLQFGVAR